VEGTGARAGGGGWGDGVGLQAGRPPPGQGVSIKEMCASVCVPRAVRVPCVHNAPAGPAFLVPHRSRVLGEAERSATPAGAGQHGCRALRAGDGGSVPRDRACLPSRPSSLVFSRLIACPRDLASWQSLSRGRAGSGRTGPGRSNPSVGAVPGRAVPGRAGAIPPLIPPVRPVLPFDRPGRPGGPGRPQLKA
jgi:hypothetical protein